MIYIRQERIIRFDFGSRKHRGPEVSLIQYRSTTWEFENILQKYSIQYDTILM